VWVKGGHVMKNRWMLAPITITTTARLALAVGVLLPAAIAVGAGQWHGQVLPLSGHVDDTAGFALLGFMAFLASHRLRPVDLINDVMVFQGAMDVSRKITGRFSGFRGRLADGRPHGGTAGPR